MPAQIVSLLTVATGSGLTVTIPLAVAEQPDELVTVTLYRPAVVVLMLAVVAPVLHTYVPPTPAPDAVIVAVLPAHTAGLVTDGVGLATAVTVPLAVAVQPFALVTVTLYVPAVDVMRLDKVSAALLLQAYLVAPVTVATSVSGAPEQLIALLTDTVGSA